MRKGIGASQIVPDLRILLKHYEELHWLHGPWWPSQSNSVKLHYTVSIIFVV